MNTQESVINIWKSNNFIGLQKLQKILKEKDIKIKTNDLKDIISKQRTAQIHKQFRKNQKTLGHIVSYAKDYKWQIDLADMQAYSSKNRGYKYILLAVDIFSRKAYAEPLKNKTEKEVTDSFHKIVEREVPKILMSDKGSEFINNVFEKELKDNNIEHQLAEVGDHHALGIIDRLTRTLKEMTYKHFTESGTVNWIDNLQKMIEVYNNLPHGGINDKKPNEVGVNNEEILQLNLIKKAEVEGKEINIKEGDKVRIRLKSFMRKGYEPRYSEEIYSVTKVFKSSVVLSDGKKYKISDLQLIQEVAENVKEVSETVKETKINNKKQKNFQKSGLDLKDILPTRRVGKVPKNRIGIHE